MRRPLLLTACLVLLCAPSWAQDKLDPSVYDQAWRAFRDGYYDRSFSGLDWSAVREKHRPKALRARTQREVHEAIIEMIGELKTSHGELIEADVYSKFYDAEAKNRLVPQFGFSIVRLEEGFFVSGVLYGSAAAAAGLVRGDRLIAINGQPLDEGALLPMPWDIGLGGPRSYRVPCKSDGDQIKLDLERYQRPKYGRYRVTVPAARWNAVEASRHSRQVFKRCGLKIGYMRLYHVLTEDVVLFLEEFLVKLKDVDAFVLDIRGQGGLPDLISRTMNFFDPNVRGKPLWDRPVVALIDGSSRSAKEAMAYSWRERRIGPLVGTRTAGAFVAASFTKLKDGSRVMIPVMDMRSLTGGVILEHVGVKPDVKVTNDDVPWCQGADPILDKGLEVVADKALAVRRRGKRHGWY